VFENRVLRRIFETTRDEVTGEWTKLHNEELHDLYSLTSIIRKIKSWRIGMGGTCGTNEGEENKLLVGKPEATRKTKT
jgi:hypothetical protein